MGGVPHHSVPASHVGGWIGKLTVATVGLFLRPPEAVDGCFPSVCLPFLCTCILGVYRMPILGQDHHQGPHSCLKASLKAALSLNELTFGCRVRSVGEGSPAGSPVHPGFYLR